MATARGFLVRPCFESDLAQVHLIYAHHVSTGFASFELTPPDPDEIRRRWVGVVSKGWPYLAASSAQDPTRVLGFAYAGAFRDRAAYAGTVEDSVYVAPFAQGRGIGRALLRVLLGELAEAGARQVVAVIGDSGNQASIRLHASAGFNHVGALRAVGRKFGRDVDVVLMQRALAAE